MERKEKKEEGDYDEKERNGGVLFEQKKRK